MNKQIIDLIYAFVHSDEIVKETERKLKETFKKVEKEYQKKRARIEKEQGGKQ